ncbi:hypothetical protein Tco_1460548, partial [Tanacetum coccineum]
MASLDRRLNPLYAIKECSSCGNLYTKDCGCSKGSLEDKILVPVPDSSQRPLKIEKICLNCGDPVHGLYCRQCALIRKTLEEVFQDFQDTSESSDDDTNFVNENQEPFVVKQGPGVNSSQSPPHIDHHCAHIGYNCPPKVPIISKPEPCNNKTVDDLPQILPSFDPICYYGDGNSFTYDSTPNFINDYPNIFNPLSQPSTYSYENCGNDAYYGYDFPPQIPICYDDDDDEESSIPLKDIIISGLPSCVAITPVLSTKEPDNSLSMGDEHLDTIPEMKSDEVIKSSDEILVPIPSESEGIPERCDVPFHDNFSPLEAFKNQFKDFFDSNYDPTSSDDDSFSIDNIEYVEA